MHRLLITLITFLSFSQFLNGEEVTYTYHNLNLTQLDTNSTIYRTQTPEDICITIPEYIKEGIKASPLLHIDELIEYLSSWTDNEYLKVKSIHDWICLNISYDMVGYNKGEIKITEPHVTLRYQNAVCGGYAALFQYMTTKIGLESVIISGYTKGKGKYAIGEQKIFTRHAWNSVKINDYYYLIDTTWDAGYVTNNKYIQKYSTDFFLLDPALFVKTHYPTAPGWLLLDSYVSIEDFKNLDEI